MPIIVWYVIFAYSQVSAAAEMEDQPQSSPESELSLLAIVPVPSIFYTPETGLGAGIGMVHAYRHLNDGAEVPNSNFIPALTYTQNNQLMVRNFVEQFEQQGQIYWSATAAYTRNPDKFFGIGNDTTVPSGESFTEISGSGEFSISRRIGTKTYLGPLLRYEEFAIRERESLGRLSQDKIVGQRRGNIGGVGLRTVHSSRDHNFDARKGRHIELSVVKHSQVLGSSFEYIASNTRIRNYWPMTETLTAAIEFTAEDLRGEVPFNRLARLGGQNLLRGYQLGRFRDKKLSAIQLELRNMFSSDFGMVLFLASGWVGSDWSRFDRKEFHHSYGAGIRLMLDRKSRISLRLDYGAGKDSNAVYMGLGESF